MFKIKDFFRFPMIPYIGEFSYQVRCVGVGGGGEEQVG